MMKLLALLLAVSAAVAYHIPNQQLDKHWELFKQTYNKKYDNQQMEYMRRMIWEDNLQYIQEHNVRYDMGHHTYSLGLNHLADMTHEEFKVTYLTKQNGRNQTRKAQKFMKPLNAVELPEQVDWRQEGYVTAVKDQGQCGSCWAFSTTGSLEGQYFRANGELVSFSEQELVDCSGNYGNMGCNGGLMDNAFQYLETYGAEKETVYPYHARQGRCNYDSSESVTKVSGFTDVESGDEDALKTAVATVGPISVAIDAGHRSFQLYSQGVYNEPACSSTQLDHGVLTVGYGTENGQDYWLVKNSWNTIWGDNGYIKMSRNQNNQCGIATQASYPNM